MRRGLTIVQDPTEAVSPEMPRRAIKYAASNHTLGVDAIAELMTKNLKPAVISPSAGAQDVKLDDEARQANLEDDAEKQKRGKPSVAMLSPILPPTPSSELHAKMIDGRAGGQRAPPERWCTG